MEKTRAQSDPYEIWNLIYGKTSKSSWCIGSGETFNTKIVVYFDQQTGALYTASRSKSYYLVFSQLFLSNMKRKRR